MIDVKKIWRKQSAVEQKVFLVVFIFSIFQFFLIIIIIPNIYTQPENVGIP